jgi:hypothetical protein
MENNNPTNFIDVHFFDGMLKTKVGKYTREEKCEAFAELEGKLQNPVAIRMLQVITEDLSTQANYQPENDLEASDILFEIVKDMDPDLLFTLEEQLADIILGLCPSGRTTRLLQLLLAIRDE